ncbi:MAG: enoyl-ACP reductase FabI [Actinomycetota bacterium]
MSERSIGVGALLDGKRLLFTGVVSEASIAFAAAAQAQRLGAEIVLTALDRDRERAVETASQLPAPVDVLDLDVTRAEDFTALTEELRGRWGVLDGALHAVAFAPRAALAGEFLDADGESVARAFAASTYSYPALARVVAELAPDDGGSIVGLDFDAAGAWPVYNWMGVCKAALESASRYVARDLGPRRIRSNLIAAGPLRTRAASGIPSFELLEQAWEDRSPLPWDLEDPAPVGDAACFLLSDMSRAITGEILHVDGGYHAMA